MQLNMDFNWNEANEINDEDLEAASDVFDRITEKIKRANQLQKAADSLKSQIDKISDGYSSNPTPKRERQEVSKQKKKDVMRSHESILRRLADDWMNGTVNPLLSSIRSRSDIETIFYSGFPTPPDDDCPIGGWYRENYHRRKKKADKLNITSKEVAKEMKTLLESYKRQETQQEKEKRELDQLIREMRFYDIPGFFPTPDSVVEKMIDQVILDKPDFLTFLEPGAGIGHIADKMRKRWPDSGYVMCEINHNLCNILSRKGYNIACPNIYDLPETLKTRVDLIIMNPPFERREDAKQIQFCYDNMLIENGLLVSVVSAGTLSSSDKVSTAFNEWLNEKNARIIHVDNGAFKSAFRSTGVSVKLISIKK